MDLHSVSLAYYSPTRTTQRVLAAIAEGVGARTLTDVDLTLPDAKTRSVPQSQDDLVLFGAPVYAGRIAATAAGRLRRVRGWGTPAVLVVVYGNRAFEDALLELADLVQSTGFLPVAAAAFIGEHSYATDAIPIALGRPDAKDLARATAFGQTIGSKLRGLGSQESLPPLAVPGHRPYRVGHQQSDVVPRRWQISVRAAASAPMSVPLAPSRWATRLSQIAERAPSAARVSRPAPMERG